MSPEPNTSNEANSQQSAAETRIAEKTQVQQVPLEESLKALQSFGAFDFLKGVVDGVDNLYPTKKVRKGMFLKDEDSKELRAELKQKINIWLDLLENNDTLAKMVDKCSERVEVNDKLIKKNLKTILDTTKEVESSYRSLHLFFANTGKKEVDNLNILNASMDKLTDTDGGLFFKHVAEKLEADYDRLDLRENYSLMVIPGYLGSKKVIDEWAKMAYENKIMLVTDYENLESPKDVVAMFSKANLTAGDLYKSNIMMTCNYIVGRGKNKDVGEEDDLYVPGSAALAGKMYNTKISQPVAGKENGTLSLVDGVRFKTLKGEISQMEDLGLVPLVKEWDCVMPFSSKTLNNSANPGMKTYSVVRTFDFVAKVMSDFLNRRAFELFTGGMSKKLKTQIIQFLDGIKGEDSLIKDWEILTFEQDKEAPDQIHLNIHITPWFPAKSFIVKLDGYNGKDSAEWKARLQEADAQK